MARKRRYRRFIERYEQRQLERIENPPHPLKRFALVCAGVIIVTVGAIIGPLPGPGGVVAIPGLFILAAEFRRVAIVLDRSEEIARPRAQRFWRFIRRKPRPAEDDEDAT